MRSHELTSRGRRFLLPAAICVVAVLAGCGTAQTPASPAAPGSPASPAAPASPPGTPAASPPASTPAPAPPEAGTWRLLPAAPATGPFGSLVSVWTGSQMLIRGVSWGQPPKAVTLSYTPATGVWRTLAPGPAPVTLQGGDNAIWTGREMLTFGPGGHRRLQPGHRRLQPGHRRLQPGHRHLAPGNAEHAGVGQRRAGMDRPPGDLLGRRLLRRSCGGWDGLHPGG